MGVPSFSQSTGKARRHFRRFKTNLYITYSLPGMKETEAGVVITKNISGGGMLFESLWEIPVGTVFNLSIHLPTTTFPIAAKGKVARIRKTRPYGRYDVGMSLVEILEEDRYALIKYLVSTFLTKRDCESLFGKETRFAEIPV